jgi:hypothetical protein
MSARSIAQPKHARSPRDHPDRFAGVFLGRSRQPSASSSWTSASASLSSQLPQNPISSGSDLRAVAPRELLGIFVGLRAWHMRDSERADEAERDYLLARHLFPSIRKLYIAAMAVAIERSGRMFEQGELGSPQSFADWINTQYRVPVLPVRNQPDRFPFRKVVIKASV